MKTKLIISLVIFFQFSALSSFGQTLYTKSDTIQLDQDSLILKVDEYRGQIQWQFSNGSDEWKDIEGATTDSLFIQKIDSSGFYRAKIVDGNCDPIYSDTLGVISFDLKDAVTNMSDSMFFGPVAYAIEQEIQELSNEQSNPGYLFELYNALKELKDTVEKYYSVSELEDAILSFESDFANEELKSTASLNCDIINLGLGYVKGNTLDVGAGGSIGIGIYAALNAQQGGGIETVYDFVNLTRQVYVYKICLLSLENGAGIGSGFGGTAGYSGYSKWLINIPTYQENIPNRFDGTSVGKSYGLSAKLKGGLGLGVDVLVGTTQEFYGNCDNVFNMMMCPAYINQEVIPNGIIGMFFSIGGTGSAGAEVELALAYKRELAASCSFGIEESFKDFKIKRKSRMLAAVNMANEIMIPSLKGLNVVSTPFDIIASAAALVYAANNTEDCSLSTFAHINTTEASNITSYSANIGGEIVSDGGSPLLERGFYWSTDSITNSEDSIIVVDGFDVGSFSIVLNNLEPNTQYYYRAYATNEHGTSIGMVIKFRTLKESDLDGDTFIDSRDGHEYRWIQIGEQVWMAENLAYLPNVYPPTVGNDANPYCYVTGYNGFILEEAKNTDNYKKYGVLYNWSATSNVCPNDWHLPTDIEWTILSEYISNDGYEGIVGKTLKTVTDWNDNGSGTDIYGFSALPGGTKNNLQFTFIETNGIWWTSTKNYAAKSSGGTVPIWIRILFSTDSAFMRSYSYNLDHGYSVRCLKNDSPDLTTNIITSITDSSAVSGGNITYDGGANVTARGVCWSVSQNPTVDGIHTTNGTGVGSFTSNITGLTSNTTYYVRAYAINTAGTAYGEEISFETVCQIPDAPDTITGNKTVTENAAGESYSISAVSGATSYNWTLPTGATIVSGQGTTNISVDFGTSRGNVSVRAENTCGNSSYTNLEIVIRNCNLGSFTDSRDGNTYNTIVIGSQTWMAENLAYLPNVSPPSAASYTEPFYYVYDYDGTNINEAILTTNYNTYGVLYNWPAAMKGAESSNTNPSGVQGVCPFGWHLPSDAEWKQMEMAIGMSQSEADGLNFRGTNEGAKLKATSKWKYYSNETNGTDDYCFSALPGGYISPADLGSHFYLITGRGFWWSSTEYDTNRPWFRSLLNYRTSVSRFNNSTKQWGFSVRCVKDDLNFITIPSVETDSVTAITDSSIVCGGNITYDGGANVTARGVCWSVSQNPTVDGIHTTNGTGVGSFTSNITGLTSNTTYYVRAYATNNAGIGYGEQKSFTTEIKVTIPTVATTPISSITDSSAVSGGNVTDDGGTNVTDKGVCWSTSENPTIDGSHTTDGTGTGSFTSNITWLTENTKYYVRAYATNSEGTGYGTQKSFTTDKTISEPSVTTSSITTITDSSAVSGGNVTDDGGATVTARGVCWSTSENPTVDGSHTTDGTGTGSYTSNITGLTENTTYYVRAYAINSEGTGYGNQRSFTTDKTLSEPSITTSSISSISDSSAVSGGNVTDDGGANVTARGVCWSTSENPTINVNHTTDGTGTGSFTSNITGLTTNTTYFVRAYATNSFGIGYGEQTSFTTEKKASVPSIATSSISAITDSSAVSGGNVTDDGGATVTARGVCWSTSENPTVDDSHTTDGTGTGSYTSNITGLTENTTYYVRAYATNSVGTGYGEQRSFKTLEAAIDSPKVVTNNATNITQTSARFNGEITSNGGASITEWGYVWNTVGNPTRNIDSTITISGFTTDMAYEKVGLSPGTTYYFKAWATNGEAYGYGEVKSFTTLEIAIDSPKVVTIAATNITQTSAQLNGEITSNGGAPILEWGYYWNSTGNPEDDNTIVMSGATVNMAFTKTGLTPGITYYYKSWASNSEAYGVGEVRSFTTADIATGTLVDIDGNNYNTVKIGNQWWMAENLKVNNYNDGELIQNITDNSEWSGLQSGAYCWYNNDEISYKNTYGALYNAYAVTTERLCPTGWHVPNENDWDILENYLIQNGYNYDGTTMDNKIAKSLAAKVLWYNSTVIGAIGNELELNNKSGFSALPGGQRDNNGEFLLVTGSGYWWSATEWGEANFGRYLGCHMYDLYTQGLYKNSGRSIRCIKD